MSTIQNIGEKIRILRLQKGLSQEQLALHAGLNTSYLGQVERGEKNPTIKTLDKIACGLDTSIENLIAGSEQRNGTSKDKNAVLTVLTSDDLRQLIIDTIKNNVPDTHSGLSKCNDDK
ncbi:helix-turn-helix domain-containing protein [Paenibacillus planticolens]|uniref:Helix-turn-helix domain-containing protein n=1 Tax=Paenibacillus planticolens TaxID=2654976 RepID=A0ABX1ZI72_9BACL|nr:helix-turn-helix transcriptional regulator [Paenibacillus planticolens]NOU99788.1 helix-turn-helix domain-containing protein [Paenibacillus planticolens]